MENVKEETRIFWFNKFELPMIANVFCNAVKDTAFKNARLVFNSQRRKIGGRTAYSPSITEYGFEIVCDVNDHVEIPGHRFVGYCERKSGGWIVTKLADNFEFTKKIVDDLDPKRCDVCGTRRDRKRVMILEDTDTKKLVYVGGDCARNFRNVNLDALIWSATTFNNVFGCLDPEDKDYYGGGRWVFGLAESVVVAELLISRLGYVSKKEAEIKWKTSTAELISCYYAGKGESYEAVKDVMERSKLDFVQRFKELTHGGLVALKADFETRPWSEFNNNMITWLSCENDVPFGVAAYIASLNVEGAKKSERTDKQVTGYDGAPIGKMSDFGWFKVVNVKAKTNSYNDDSDSCFTCVNIDDQKVWFRIGERSQANRTYEGVTGHWEHGDWHNHVGMDQEVWVELRGKLKQTKKEIAFASHIKIKNVEIRDLPQ